MRRRGRFKDNVAIMAVRSWDVYVVIRPRPSVDREV